MEKIPGERKKEREVSRRNILKTGIAAAAVAAAYTTKAAHAAEALAAPRGKRYAMVIDLKKCIGCHTCSVSCKAEFDVPLGVWRSWVKYMEKGKYPNVKRHFLPRLCNHCDNPPCVRVCPVQATYKSEDGAVLQRYDRCVGCKYCIQACPYSARHLLPRKTEVSPYKHVVDKCTFCVHRVEKGLDPSCVNACPANARTFGNLNDPDSEVAKLVYMNPTSVLKPGSGTEPQVYYIALDNSIVGGATETHNQAAPEVPDGYVSSGKHAVRGGK